jgi:hypothetical protein
MVEEKKKKNTSKAKGSGWERQISAMLTKWVSGVEKPYIFYRVPNSGGMYTINKEIGEHFSGDICAIKEEGKFLTNKFNIECKTGYSGISLDNHLKKKKNDTLLEFWKQCIRDCDNKKYPMLIYKKTGLNPWIGLGSIITRINLDLPCIKLIWKEEPTLHLYDLKDFLNVVTPQMIKEL